MTTKRVLVWGLSSRRAGTEMVISNYARAAEGVAFDFLCYEEPTSFADLFAEGTGNRAFTIPVKIRQPVAYARALRRFMAEHGSGYDALWFNAGDVSNIDPLVWAERCGIPCRIAHMHSASMPPVAVTQVFSRLNWGRFQRLVTERWACSEAAGRFFYGDAPFQVIPNAVDAAAVAFSEEGRQRARERHGLADARVIGHVGRLSPEKNQAHLVALLPELLQARPETRLLLVGEGPLAGELAEQARALGVEEAVVFAGSQDDVAGCLSAMDAFAFPSRFEGLSLALLEAQFNGLPCVVSEGVGAESLVASSCSQVPLADQRGWARALGAAERGPRLDLRPEAARYDLGRVRAQAARLFAGLLAEG